MLADEIGNAANAGTLGEGIHQPSEWLSSLIRFIAAALPGWRDDQTREEVRGETRLTTQLCARLNSLSRHSPGWDILQFRREEPDEGDSRRSIDLVAAPSGEVILIAGREYTEYQVLMPMECKRLPTPAGHERDEREYLISRFNTTGGVHRFKEGHHASAHDRAAMIGYIQSHDVAHWKDQIGAWINELAADAAEGWTADDMFTLVEDDRIQRSGSLYSNHARKRGLGPIRIDHLWIEMSPAAQ